MKFDKNIARFSIAIISLVFGIVYLLIASFLEVPEANQRTVDTVVGFITATMMALPLGYYLGSSQGSSDKQDIIEKKQP